MTKLLFADDSALVAHYAEKMQKIVDAFSDASKKFSLKININKDRGAVPTQLYKNPIGGYHGLWKQAGLCSGIHLPRKHYIK